MNSPASHPPAGEVTQMLHAMRSGDPAAAERLLPLLYDELHRLARAYMRRERPDHTLQATALIHEAYLRLAGKPIDWTSRAHFIGFAARVMRQVLVDHARVHGAAAASQHLCAGLRGQRALRGNNSVARDNHGSALTPVLSAGNGGCDKGESNQ